MTKANENKNVARSDLGRAFFKFPTTGAHIIFWPLVIGGAWLDLWSKQAVFDWLAGLPYAEYSIIDGCLRFIIAENTGAAFSMASGQTALLIGVSVVALIIVIGMFLFGNVRQKIVLISLALLTAGIIGNLYDRVFNDGKVRDFVDVYYQQHHWPTFNVADSMLCIAVGLLIISHITSASCQKPAHQQK